MASNLRNRKQRVNEGVSKKDQSVSKGVAAPAEPSNTRVVIMLVLTAILAATAYASHGKVPNLLGEERSPIKQYHTAEEFYVRYLSEHKDPTTKLLHCVGSIIVLMSGSVSPTVYISGVFAGSIGYILCEALCALDHGFVEFGVMLACFLLSTKFLTGYYNWFVLVVGYGFAWYGHFVYEKNKPATFIYPTYSLMGDFHMLFDVLTQKISISPLD